MHECLLRGNREISVTTQEFRLRGRFGKTSVVADDERDGEVGLADSTCEAGEQGGTIRCGVGGGKQREQEECGTAKHCPDSEPGGRVTAQDRIRGAVNRNKKGKLTALLHHVNIDVLRWAFFKHEEARSIGC